LTAIRKVRKTKSW